MVSLDMIAFNNVASPNRAAIHCRAASSSLQNTLANAATVYGGLTPVTGTALDGNSDHAPFENYGFQGCLLIEGGYAANPYYHTAGDSVDSAGYLDYTFAANMTKTAVGYLSDAALMTPEPGFAAAVFFCAAVCAILRRSKLHGTA